MKTEKRKNSALKKLIPAVAMLATSAVMLSTATYAWFTMNKEVTMTGLNMTATVGEGIEISLASVTGDNNTLKFSGFSENKTYPPDTSDEKGWKSAVVVGNYYTSFGKIKPSSSVNGTTFFDATDASDGGKVASTFKTVDAATSDSGFIVTQTSLDTNNAKVDANETTGYYIDIPVHIRTSKSAESGSGNIFYKMTIDDADETEGKDLYKAVRVAFIQNDVSTVILGADKTYYDTGAVANIDGNGKGTRAAVTVNSDTTGAVFGSVTDANYISSVGVDSGLDIPYATSAGTYGHLDFTVRVWLEGESTFCYDEKAGQSWNINLAFSLGEFTVPQGN